MNFDIPERKITQYLLVNPKKSGFFLRTGYTVQAWTRLRDDILGMTNRFPLIFEREDQWGKKYAIRGVIVAPDERMINVTTIWMVKPDHPTSADFLTAYPT
jgi:hypothetical protein